MITNKIMFESNGILYSTLARAKDAEEDNFQKLIKQLLCGSDFTASDCYKISVALLENKNVIIEKLKNLEFKDCLGGE